MVVGSYTVEQGKSLFLYRFCIQNGNCEQLDSCRLNNPSYVASDTTGRFIYAVNEIKGDAAGLTALRVDVRKGRLEVLNTVYSGGASPCYVAVSRRLAAVANYNGGSMSLFYILDDGSLSGLVHIIKGRTGGPDQSRQFCPHVHCACFSLDGKYIFASDFSADRILRYPLTGNKNEKALCSWSVETQGGYGPRHLVFSPDGRFLYLIGELSDRVTVFEYTEGNLTKVQSILADYDRGRGGADIRISPDGRFLYTSHRLYNDKIVIFSRNPSNGKLDRIGQMTTAEHPRQFAITPDGRFFLVACLRANKIQIFGRNVRTGLLHDMHHDIYIPKVSCVTFLHGQI